MQNDTHRSHAQPAEFHRLLLAHALREQKGAQCPAIIGVVVLLARGRYIAAALPTQETWYALVANANFMFNDVQNEALAEQLREKKRFYGEQVCTLPCSTSSAHHNPVHLARLCGRNNPIGSHHPGRGFAQQPYCYSGGRSPLACIFKQAPSAARPLYRLAPPKYHTRAGGH